MPAGQVFIRFRGLEAAGRIPAASLQLVLAPRSVASLSTLPAALMARPTPPCLGEAGARSNRLPGRRGLVLGGATPAAGGTGAPSPRSRSGPGRCGPMRWNDAPSGRRIGSSLSLGAITGSDRREETCPRRPGLLIRRGEGLFWRRRPADDGLQLVCLQMRGRTRCPARRILAGRPRPRESENSEAGTDPICLCDTWCHAGLDPTASCCCASSPRSLAPRFHPDYRMCLAL